MPNPAFELSIDVRLLSERLMQVGIGEQVSYAELGDVINQPVHGGAPALQSALRRCFRNEGAIFENVRGIGYQRLTDHEIVSASERDVRGIRRKSKRAAQKLASVRDYNALPKDKKVEHSARLSILSAVAQQTSRNSEKKVIEAVESQGRELPFAATLEAFKGSR